MVELIKLNPKHLFTTRFEPGSLSLLPIPGVSEIGLENPKLLRGGHLPKGEYRNEYGENPMRG